jgi:hypothetical protein
MKIIITEDQNKIYTAFKRRLDIVNKMIEELDPQTICDYWGDESQAEEYINDVLNDIAYRIMLMMGGNREIYVEIYEMVKNFGYRNQIEAFYYTSLNECY